MNVIIGYIYFCCLYTLSAVILMAARGTNSKGKVYFFRFFFPWRENYCLGQIDHLGPEKWASFFKFLTENGQEEGRSAYWCFFRKIIFCGNQKFMILISYNILFTQFLFSENVTRGYVYDISKINLAKNRKTKYFNFII